jgi:Fic family protein/DNA-binding Xre family transcriptional regulator
MLKDLIKKARVAKEWKVRELAQKLAVDQALVSKFESGERLPTEEQLEKIAYHLEVPFSELAVLWLRHKIMREIRFPEYALDAINMVREEYMEYHSKYKREFSPSLEVLLGEIDELKKKLDALREHDSFRIAQALELEYTFESNRIEGNTLTLRETDLVVNEGLTVSGKSLREHLEAINHKDAIEYMKEMVAEKGLITERELLTFHNLILRGIHPEHAGRYRQVQVMIQGSAHIPPQPYEVISQMYDYFEWYRENSRKLHPVILAAEMHEKLVTIHPFIDGNGRTARLIMNLILLRHGYVIANIKGDYNSRMAYYESLESVQTKRSTEDFCLFAANVEKECLERYLSIIAPGA